MTLSTACAIVGWQHGVGNAPMGSTRNREAGIETGPEGQDGTGKKRESGSLQACRETNPVWTTARNNQLSQQYQKGNTYRKLGG